MIIKNAILFVDGSNLYGSQYKIFGPKEYLNFSKLARILEKKLLLKFSEILFYASYSPKPKITTPKSVEYLKNEGLFYKNVKETPKITFFKGYRSKTSGKEKEVDVKLSVDIVKYAYEKKCNQIYLLSGDADFLQALFAIQHLPISINILCVENTVMFKGAYYFKTNVIDFIPDNLNLKIDQKQKISILKISKQQVVLK